MYGLQLNKLKLTGNNFKKLKFWRGGYFFVIDRDGKVQKNPE